MCFKEFIQTADSKVRARGKDYYQSRRVSELKKIGANSWTAKVRGSQLYKTRISVSDGEVDYWDCSCPYDGEVCKHVIAVCYAIMDSQAAEKSPSRSASDQDNRLDMILETMDVQELKSQLKEILTSIPRLSNGFVLSNLHRLKPDYKKLVQDLCSEAENNLALYESLTLLIATLDDLIESGRLDEAWDISTHLIRIAAPELRALDDEAEIDEEDWYDYEEEEPEAYYYEFRDSLIMSCETLVNKADEALKRRVFTWTVDYLKEEPDELTHLLIIIAQNCVLDPEMGQRFLECLDLIIASENTETHILKAALDAKLEYLSEFGNAEDAFKLIMAHQDLDEYKIKLIMLLIELEEWDRARGYIRKYLSEIDYNPRLEHGLITLMITISARTKDTVTHIEFQRRLFYLDNCKMEHYKGLKAICPPALWPAEKAGIETELNKKSYHAPTLALIHLENKEYDKILELLIRQPGLSDLWLKYDKYAIQADRARFISAYREAICDALKDTGRSVYERAAEHLKHLYSVTQDRNLIRNLILELKSQYKNRRAMIEIFDKGFGKML